MSSSTASQLPTQSVSSLHKRPYCSNSDEESMEPAPKIATSVRWYHVVLESESSHSSDHDTESVHSIQDRETDVARDTTDTDSASDVSDAEFEVASLSEDDDHTASFWGDVHSDSSSGTDDILRTGVFAAICEPEDSDSDIRFWAADTDDEEGDLENSRSSMLGVSKQPRILKCAQCKGINNNPLYPYCEKCYQVRKTIFPPRPKPYRSRNQNTAVTSSSNKSSAQSIIEPEKLRSFLTTLSQDSGVGLSQDLVLDGSRESVGVDQLPAGLALDKIVVPEELVSEGEEAAVASEANFKPTDSDSSTSNSGRGENTHRTANQLKTTNVALSENDMCMVCNQNPKNGIFVHGGIGHMCCCYKCAVKVWTKIKRCPVCNCKVKNVLKVFLT